MMKNKALKDVLWELVIYIIFWIIGVVLFWSLIMLCQEKFHYSVDWLWALIISIVPAFIWFIIGSTLTWKDDKDAEGRKTISDTVKKWFRNSE